MRQNTEKVVPLWKEKKITQHLCLHHGTPGTLLSACTSGVMVSELAHYCVKLGIMGLAAPPAAFCKMETGHIEYCRSCKY